MWPRYSALGSVAVRCRALNTMLEDSRELEPNDRRLIVGGNHCGPFTPRKIPPLE